MSIEPNFLKNGLFTDWTKAEAKAQWRDGLRQLAAKVLKAKKPLNVIQHERFNRKLTILSLAYISDGFKNKERAVEFLFENPEVLAALKTDNFVKNRNKLLSKQGCMQLDRILKELENQKPYLNFEKTVNQLHNYINPRDPFNYQYKRLTEPQKNDFKRLIAKARSILIDQYSLTYDQEQKMGTMWGQLLNYESKVNVFDESTRTVQQTMQAYRFFNSRLSMESLFKFDQSYRQLTHDQQGKLKIALARMKEALKITGTVGYDREFIKWFKEVSKLMDRVERGEVESNYYRTSNAATRAKHWIQQKFSNLPLPKANSDANFDLVIYINQIKVLARLTGVEIDITITDRKSAKMVMKKVLRSIHSDTDRTNKPFLEGLDSVTTKLVDIKKRPDSDLKKLTEEIRGEELRLRRATCLELAMNLWKNLGKVK